MRRRSAIRSSLSQWGGSCRSRGQRLRSGEPLPVPSSLANLLGRRLARLSSDTRRVLLIAAPRGTADDRADSGRRGTLEQARARRSTRPPTPALSSEIGAGFGSRIRCSRPCCTTRRHPELRTEVHQALAGTVSDVEERARHLTKAADGPNASIAAEVAAAAEHAAARGAPAAGAELYELAGELTPADPALARRRRLQAATLHRLAGDRKQGDGNARAAPRRGSAGRGARQTCSSSWPGRVEPTPPR